MDMSPEYCKMCDRAEEIQNTWQVDSGDWITARGFNNPYPIGDLIVSHIDETTVGWELPRKNRTFHKLNYIWLPRQDQLQEMVGTFYECQGLFHRYKDVGEPFTFDDWESMRSPLSMEQLWLALVMKYKYHKIWTLRNIWSLCKGG